MIQRVPVRDPSSIAHVSKREIYHPNPGNDRERTTQGASFAAQNEARSSFEGDAHACRSGSEGRGCTSVRWDVRFVTIRRGGSGLVSCGPSLIVAATFRPVEGRPSDPLPRFETGVPRKEASVESPSGLPRTSVTRVLKTAQERSILVHQLDHLPSWRRRNPW